MPRGMRKARTVNGIERASPDARVLSSLILAGLAKTATLGRGFASRMTSLSISAWDKSFRRPAQLDVRSLPVARKVRHLFVSRWTGPNAIDVHISSVAKWSRPTFRTQ